MVEDVDHAVRGRCPIKTCLCSGGNVMSREAVVEAVEKLLNKERRGKNGKDLFADKNHSGG